ncbi:hypothetical protein MC885_007152 [Smutsia gigantea]|nr:hypothetical protein MC885_007152 [Smutsia gigantea]
MLCKVVKVLTAKEMTLESSESTVSDLTASLQEKERAIKATSVEITKPHSPVDLKLQEVQHLKNYGDHSETRGQGFAECKDTIQCQEQDSVHLKLQHTLDVEELQGPGYTSNSSLKPHVLQSSAARSHSNIPSSQSTASFASHHSMKSNTLRENPTRDLKQLVQELSSVVSEEASVPLGKTEEDGRTPSLGVSHVAVSNSSLRDSTHSSKSSETLSRDLVTFHAGT